MNRTRRYARRLLAASRTWASFGATERAIAIEAAWTLLVTHAGRWSTRTLADAARLGRTTAHSTSHCDVGMICRVASSIADTLFPASRCLERSVSIGKMLRRRGIDASIVIGIQVEDGALRGHAWLESNGLPLGASPELPHRFARVTEHTLADYEWKRGIVWQKT